MALAFQGGHATGVGRATPPPASWTSEPKPHSASNRLLSTAAVLLAGGQAAAVLASAFRRRAQRRRGRAGAPLLARACEGKVAAPEAPEGAGLEAEGLGQETFQELEGRLQQALQREDYDEAARIRDSLQERKMGGEFSVLCANSNFLAAVKSRDIAVMADLWHKGDHSCCIHQAQRPVHGHEAVLESWRDLFRNRKYKKNIEYEVKSVVIRDNIGRIVATSEKHNSVVTNFFEHTPDGWKLWCHQVGTIKPVKPKPGLATLALSVPNGFASAIRAVVKRISPGRKAKEPEEQTEEVRELEEVRRGESPWSR